MECILLAESGERRSVNPEEGHRQVLVVDDDAAIRKLVASVLRRSGFLVDTAEDGVEAVLKMGLVEYDAIVLDLMMPNLDGFEVLSTVGREKPEILDRFIVTSAASPQVIATRMRGVSFALLPKPFELAELLRRVGEVAARPRIS